MKLRLDSNLQFSCLSLLSVGITGVATMPGQYPNFLPHHLIWSDFVLSVNEITDSILFYVWPFPHLFEICMLLYLTVFTHFHHVL
jgi:hypothetical protein